MHDIRFLTDLKRLCLCCQTAKEAQNASDLLCLDALFGLLVIETTGTGEDTRLAARSTNLGRSTRSPNFKNSAAFLQTHHSQVVAMLCFPHHEGVF